VQLIIFEAAIRFVQILAQVLVIAIILRSIFMWFVKPGQENALLRILVDVTEPMLRPLRRVMPSMGMLDLSPFVAILLIQYVITPIVLMVLERAASAAAFG
jgi:YggT family protein